jgi:hypothetical protein
MLVVQLQQQQQQIVGCNSDNKLVALKAPTGCEAGRDSCFYFCVVFFSTAPVLWFKFLIFFVQRVFFFFAYYHHHVESHCAWHLWSASVAATTANQLERACFNSH